MGCSLTLCSPNCNSKTPKKYFCFISVLSLLSVEKFQAQATGPMRSGDGGHGGHRQKRMTTMISLLRNYKLSSKVTFLKSPMTLFSTTASKLCCFWICDFVHLRVSAAINQEQGRRRQRTNTQIRTTGRIKRAPPSHALFLTSGPQP